MSRTPGTAELSARISYINSVAFYLNELAAFKLRARVASDRIHVYLQDADLRELEKAGLIPVPLDPNAAFHDRRGAAHGYPQCH